MNQIFFTVLNMSIMAGILTAAICLLRLLFIKCVPKWLICIFWAVVAIRLVIPFSIESPISVIPKEVQTLQVITGLDSKEEDAAVKETVISASEPSNRKDVRVNTGAEAVTGIGENEVLNSDKAMADRITILEGQTSGSYVESRSAADWIRGNFWIIWIAGAVAILICGLISFIKLSFKLKASVRLNNSERDVFFSEGRSETNRIRIYANDGIASPFLLGIFRPSIYIPSSMAFDRTKEKELEFVLLHEASHIKRGDHFWKPLGFILLALNWFNPLIWLGYILFCRDIEAACDEKVISRMTEKERADYSRTLLEFSSSCRELAACPVAFGENGTKSRIKLILSYRKPAFWIVIVSIAVCIIAAGCTMTVRPEQENTAAVETLQESTTEAEKGSDKPETESSGSEITEALQTWEDGAVGNGFPADTLWMTARVVNKRMLGDKEYLLVHSFGNIKADSVSKLMASSFAAEYFLPYEDVLEVGLMALSITTDAFFEGNPNAYLRIGYKSITDDDGYSGTIEGTVCVEPLFFHDDLHRGGEQGPFYKLNDAVAAEVSEDDIIYSCNKIWIDEDFSYEAEETFIEAGSLDDWQTGYELANSIMTKAQNVTVELKLPSIAENADEERIADPEQIINSLILNAVRTGNRTWPEDFMTTLYCGYGFYYAIIEEQNIVHIEYTFIYYDTLEKVFSSEGSD